MKDVPGSVLPGSVLKLTLLPGCAGFNDCARSEVGKGRAAELPHHHILEILADGKKTAIFFAGALVGTAQTMNQQDRSLDGLDDIP